MKTKATRDLDKEEEGQAFLPPPLTQAARSFPGRWSMVPRRLLCWKPGVVQGPSRPSSWLATTGRASPNLVAFRDWRLRLVQGLRDFWGGEGGGGG